MQESAKAYSESSQTSKMENFAKVGNGFKVNNKDTRITSVTLRQ